MDIKNLKVNLESKVLASDKVIIVPHRGIDLDAIGAAIGLTLISEKLKKKSHIIVDEQLYNIDHGVETIIREAKENTSIINLDKYEQLREDNDLFILTDVNKESLIHQIKGLKKKNTIIIDHHKQDETTIPAEIEFIDTNISSASEIIATLLHQFKIKYSKEVANYLLAGILLDTNRLTKNASCETMKIINKLLDNGASMTTANEYFIEDFNSDRRVQDFVNRTKFLNFTIAIIEGSDDEEYTKEELAKAADYLLRYKIDAAYAIGKIGEDTISISARSKERVNVGDVMEELEGGGNQYSAATKINGNTIEEVGKSLVKIISPKHYIK